MLGFSYEKGYADYFGIPVQLIRLNLLSIFLSIGGLIGLLWFVFLVSNLGYMVFAGRSGVIRLAITRSAPLLLVYFGLLYIYRNTSTWQLLKWIVFLPLTQLFFEFVWPLITQRGKGTYYEKLKAQQEARKRVTVKEPNTIWSVIVQKQNGLTMLQLFDVAVILFVLYGSAHMIGGAEAQRQKSFLIMREPKPLAVLRIYGDQFVCATFDPKVRTVDKTLYLLDAQKQDGFWLDWQQIGPLKPIRILSHP